MLACLVAYNSAFKIFDKATDAKLNYQAAYNDWLKASKWEKEAAIGSVEQQKALKLMAQWQAVCNKFAAERDALLAAWSKAQREMLDPQHFDWAKQLLDSSVLGSATYFKDVQDEGINHRPYYNSSTPLSLMSSALGRFLAAYQAESPTGADYGVAMSLCEVLSQDSIPQARLLQELRTIFIDQFGSTGLEVIQVEHRECGGHLEIRLGSHLLCVVVAKPDGGDTYEAGQMCYLRHLLQAPAELRNPHAELGCTPVLLLECFSGCVRVSALAWQRRSSYLAAERPKQSDMLLCEPLSDAVAASNVRNKAHMRRLATTAGALCGGVHNLADLHRHADTMEPCDGIAFTWPYWLARDYRKSGIQQYAQETPLFLVTPPAAPPVVVKFVQDCDGQQLAARVQALWAEVGAACKLQKPVETLPGGWLVLVLPALLPEHGWWTLDALRLPPEDKGELLHPPPDVTPELWVSIKAKAEELLQAAHGLVLQDDNGTAHLTVHGDLHGSNVMVRLKRYAALDVRIIDFDWAGYDNSSLYPGLINRDTVWRPDTVQPLGVMRQQHDIEMLAHAFE